MRCTGSCKLPEEPDLRKAAAAITLIAFIRIRGIELDRKQSVCIHRSDKRCMSHPGITVAEDGNIAGFKRLQRIRTVHGPVLELRLLIETTARERSLDRHYYPLLFAGDIEEGTQGI